MDGAEARRFDLLRKLEAVLGKQEAETLMAHLPPVDWSRLVTTDYLDTRLNALSSELRLEMSELRSELRAEMSDLRSEMSEVRSELHSEISQVRLDMARWGRTQVYATVGAVVAAGGLAFTAAGLA